MFKMFTKKEKVETVETTIMVDEEETMEKMKNAMMTKIRREMMEQAEAEEDLFKKKYVRWN